MVNGFVLKYEVNASRRNNKNPGINGFHGYDLKYIMYPRVFLQETRATATIICVLYFSEHFLFRSTGDSFFFFFLFFFSFVNERL